MQRRQLIPGAMLLLTGAMSAASLQEAGAAITNRYSFTTDANDSIGGANGTVIDAGVPTGVFAGGQFDMSANTGQGSNSGISEDAYVDFPNGIISAAANGGTPGQLTIETWATSSTNRGWAALFSAGTSNGGEGVSDGGNAADYIQIIPQNGATNVIRTTTHTKNVGTEGFVDFNVPMSTTDQTHLVTVYDQSGGLPGTITLYVNGKLAGTNPMAAGFNLSTLVDNNIWLGRSQWPDSIFDGKINELRVYNTAMTATDALSHAVFGPDVLNPGGNVVLEVNKNTGAVTLKNTASAPLAIDFLRISSVGGALSTANWNSLDTQNFGAVDGPDAGSVAGDSAGEGWDKATAGSNANQLVEQFLGAAGSTLAANSSISLGNAFNTSIFGSGVDGDLVLEFGLNGGALITSTVSYVGVAGLPGDFNNSGKVDGADFLLWQRNFGQPGYDAASLATWKANFGAGAAEVAAAAVPEPAALGLIVMAGIALAATRRQR
ncbi:hypothetical protein PLANPX_4267 [Lacipirellula parvula]|uniref:PEP-CTERM protein-sorting domain-containing protein n=2 Tax=Lacipirellula parvula TaxID=2650471 RepID=A0A5K7XE32_9BACT|nr:hypothetical protein PLANPX_4267 [Lacipirellula parvula]